MTKLTVASSSDASLSEVFQAESLGGVSWNLAGTLLVFDGILSGTDSGIYVVNSDGSGVHRILEDWRNQGFSYGYFDPEWQPSAASAAPWPGEYARLSGQTRYETAVEISKSAFPGGADTVVVATGLNYPDALAGAVLANAIDGPLLLVNTVLPDAVASEISRLGAKHAYVLGTSEVVSEQVAARIQQLTGGDDAPVRLGGIDRYETAALIAKEVARLSPNGTIANRTAVIATGLNFPDALAGSPLAAAKGWPILLTRSGAAPSFTTQALADLGITRTIVLGGEDVVSATVALDLPAPTRLAGASRYDTMGAIADFMASQGLGTQYISLATGANFPDALTGGVLTAKRSGVMLLTPPTSLAPQARTRLEERAETCSILHAYGGPDVVGDSVVTAAKAALQ